MRRALLAAGAAALAIALTVTSSREEEDSMAPRWTLLKPELPEGHTPEALIFEQGVGIVAGSLVPVEAGVLVTELMARAEAFILRLPPGGRAWTKVFTGRGEVFRISPAGAGVFYALGETALRTGDRVVFLEKSVDQGQTWRPRPPPPEGTLGIRFVADGRGYAWTDDRILATEDDGSAWTEVVRVGPGALSRGGPDPAVVRSGDVWVATAHGIVHARPSGPSRPQAPGLKVRALAAAPDGSAWGAGEAPDGSVHVFRATDAAIEPLGALNVEGGRWLVEALHVATSTAILLASDVGEGDQRPRSFAFVSRDGGRSWSRERPAVQGTTMPCWFEGDETVWAYANFGRVQVRARP